MNRQEQGALAESLAREYLEASGYTFVEANFTRRVGEIDLVMLAPEDHQKQRSIVFVEVRYRKSSRFGGALASIDWRKQRKMLRAAQAWLQKNADSTDPARIDVIAIGPLGSEPPGRDPAGGYPIGSDPLASVEIWRDHQLHWIRNAVENAT